MRKRERALVLRALDDLQRASAIIADCRAGLCPIELDDAPEPLDRAIAALAEALSRDYLDGKLPASLQLGEVRDSYHHDIEARARHARERDG